MMILDGYNVAKKIRKELKDKVKLLQERNIFPKLVVIQIGNDEASSLYIRNKKNACEEVGVLFEEIHFSKEVTEQELEIKIEQLNNDESVHGILIQSPLPSHLDKNRIFNLVSAEKDVDGFTDINIAKLYRFQACFIPCTAKGVIRLLKEYKIPISGKNVVIAGRSNIVGKPLAMLFLQENATVTILHSKSLNKEKIMYQADILVSAIGKPKIINASMVKENAVVIDVGINFVDQKIVGDVDFQNVALKASYITPVPKGVGPMTVAMLLENVIEAAQIISKDKYI